MSTPINGDEFSHEVTDISVEEFRRSELLNYFISLIDVDLLVISNRNLHLKAVCGEFLKFSMFITKPRNKEHFLVFLTPVFQHLYLLLLSHKGKADADRFTTYYRYLPIPSNVLNDLLQCQTCEDVQLLINSTARIRVKLSSYAYYILMNWLRDSFSESSKMFHILRVLHENFHLDIYLDEDDEEFAAVEFRVMLAIEEWRTNYYEEKGKKKSYSEVAETCEKPETDHDIMTQKMSELDIAAKNPETPKIPETSEMPETSKMPETLEMPKTPEMPETRKKPESVGGGTKFELKASMFKLRDSARRYLEKVKKTAKEENWTMQQLEEALLNPPDPNDPVSSDDDDDQKMDFHEDAASVTDKSAAVPSDPNIAGTSAVPSDPNIAGTSALLNPPDPNVTLPSDDDHEMDYHGDTASVIDESTALLNPPDPNVTLPSAVPSDPNIAGTSALPSDLNIAGISGNDDMMDILDDELVKKFIKNLAAPENEKGKDENVTELQENVENEAGYAALFSQISNFPLDASDVENILGSAFSPLDPAASVSPGGNEVDDTEGQENVGHVDQDPNIENEENVIEMQENVEHVEGVNDENITNTQKNVEYAGQNLNEVNDEDTEVEENVGDTDEDPNDDYHGEENKHKLEPQYFTFKKHYKSNFHSAYPVTITGKDVLCSSDVSSDLKYLACGFESCKICTWRLGENFTLQPIGTLRGHKKIVYALSIDANTKILISGSHDHTVRIWDIEDSVCLSVVSAHSAPVYAVCASPNSRYFLSASEDKKIILFWYDQIYPVRVYVGHSLEAINCVRFHPNCAYFASASSDGNLFLFKINEDSRPVRMFTKHIVKVYTLSFSPCGKQLASADVEGNLIIWDILTQAPIKTLKATQGIRSIAYDTSGSFIAALFYFKSWKIYNIAEENVAVVVEVEGAAVPKSVHFSDDNKMLIIQYVAADESVIGGKKESSKTTITVAD